MSGSATPRVVTVDLDDVQRRLCELEAHIAELGRERDGLQALIALARNPRYGESCRWDLPAPTLDCTTSGDARVRGPTHREMILTVLEDGAAMGVRQILNAIHARFGAQPDRNSISPLLRKLANRGEITHDPAAAKWATGKRSAEPEMTAGEVVAGRFGGHEEDKEVSGRSAA